MNRQLYKRKGGALPLGITGSDVTGAVGDIAGTAADAILPGSGEVLKPVVGWLGDTIQTYIDVNKQRQENLVRVGKREDWGIQAQALLDAAINITPEQRNEAQNLIYNTIHTGDLNTDNTTTDIPGYRAQVLQKIKNIIAGTNVSKSQTSFKSWIKNSPLSSSDKSQILNQLYNYDNATKSVNQNAALSIINTILNSNHLTLPSGTNISGTGISDDVKTVQRQFKDSSLKRSLLEKSVGEVYGDGIKELFDDVKYRIQNLGKIRTTLNPDSRKVIEKLGHLKIKQGWVCRKEINSILKTVVKLTTSIPYEKIFHLSIHLILEHGRVGVPVTMEKNEMPEIYLGENKNDRECRPIGGIEGITLKQLNDATLKYMGAEKYFRYLPVNNNCQLFVKGVIRGNNLQFDDSGDFILQDVINHISKPVGTIATKITDLANIFRNLIQGKGLILDEKIPITKSKKSMITQSVIFERSIWTISKAREWLKSHKYIQMEVDKKPHFYRFRQLNPEEFKKESFRTKKLDNSGIELVIGRLQ